MASSVFARLHLFQLLHKFIDAVHLRGDVDLLWAVLSALVAADAMTGLPQSRNVAVVADKETFPRLPIGFCLAIAGGHIAMDDALVVVGKHSRNVQSVRAGHAVVAGGTWHGFQFDEQFGYLH